MDAGTRLAPQRSLRSTTEGAIVRRHVIPLTFPELGLIAGTRGIVRRACPALPQPPFTEILPRAS